MASPPRSLLLIHVTLFQRDQIYFSRTHIRHRAGKLSQSFTNSSNLETDKMLECMGCVHTLHVVFHFLLSAIQCSCFHHTHFTDRELMAWGDEVISPRWYRRTGSLKGRYFVPAYVCQSSQPCSWRESSTLLSNAETSRCLIPH